MCVSWNSKNTLFYILRCIRSSLLRAQLLWLKLYTCGEYPFAWQIESYQPFFFKVESPTTKCPSRSQFWFMISNCNGSGAITGYSLICIAFSLLLQQRRTIVFNKFVNDFFRLCFANFNQNSMLVLSTLRFICVLKERCSPPKCAKFNCVDSVTTPYTRWAHNFTISIDI